MAFIRNQPTREPTATNERKQERDGPGLLAQLSNRDPTSRRWAARDLIDYPEAAIALVERLKIEPDLSVQEVILTTLSRLGDPAAVAELVHCLRSEDSALRNKVIETLMQLADEVAPIMQGLLADPDPDVRIFAVNILGSLCHPEVESWLIAVIENDPHVNVCATALDLLGEVGTEAALEPLARLNTRFRAEPYIQFAADLALKRILGG